MNTNIGGIDRPIRVMAGLAIIFWGVLSTNLWGIVGLIPLVTGAMQWCPAYHLMKISTYAETPSDLDDQNANDSKKLND